MVASTFLLDDWNWALDGWIVAAGILCAIASALLGNFLVLRRMSMLGDAISHAVLPGLAAAFIISGSRNSVPMFVGAVVVGVLTALFTEWISGVGKVDEGASMGVVFTSLFALGLVMIVQAADHVDLDPGCVLYGAIELTPFDVVQLGGLEIPRAVLTLGAIAFVNLAFVVLFFKELKISAFDPSLATTTGFNARLMHYLLMVLVAVTAVASFESVGSILVVAMFVVPPASAYLLTNRLAPMIVLSVLLAIVSAILGHISAVTVPGWFGYQSTTTASMMAVVAGIILFLAITFAPGQGIVAKLINRRLLSLGILADDVIALLYRHRERNQSTPATFTHLRSRLLTRSFALWSVLSWLRFRSLISKSANAYDLTNKGFSRGMGLVRSHRLWEQYLYSQVGTESSRIHEKAERYEHFTDPALRKKLDQVTDAPATDPHGTPIPKEDSDNS